jgi:hypothetical protein
MEASPSATSVRDREHPICTLGQLLTRTPEATQEREICARTRPGFRRAVQRIDQIYLQRACPDPVCFAGRALAGAPLLTEDAPKRPEPAQHPSPP